MKLEHKPNPRLLICGDRRWRNHEAILKMVRMFSPSIIIEGGATGADQIAYDIAITERIKYTQMNADWDGQGKKAGMVRNARMLRDGKPDIVIGFHDHIEYSKGTKHMLGIASESGTCEVYLFEQGHLYRLTHLFKIPRKERIF